MPALNQIRTTTGGDVVATVAFVHGVGGSHGEWDKVIAELGPGFDVVRYDLRGHGDSPKPPGPYTLAQFVEDHARVMEEQGVDRCHVVGESMGGLIAQAVAIHTPELVDRLVVMSAIAGRTPTEQQAAEKRWRQLAEHGVDRAWLQGSASRWFTDEFLAEHAELVDEFLDRIADNDPDSYAAAYGVLATNDLVDELHRITAPTLVMTGEGDVGSPPAMSERMAKLIPDAQVTILSGVKHVPSIEMPGTVARHIRSFLLLGK